MCPYKNQINAGADVVQIFDSWAGLIPENSIEDFCFIPNKKIVKFCKKEKIPTICFPKGIKKNYEKFNNFVKSDGINIDPEIDPLWARSNLQNVVIQGGLNPDSLGLIRKLQKQRRNIFNLSKIFLMFLILDTVYSRNRSDKVKMLIKFYRILMNETIKVKFGKTGIMSINLGTPDSTNWWDIRKYLKEFLSDRRVIEVNPIIWQIILNLFILTFRPSKTAHAYKQIWRNESNESPLLYFTRRQAHELKNKSVMIKPL